MILICYGTRPEWIKIKPLIEVLNNTDIKYKLLLRIDIWKETLVLIKKHWLLGSGNGTFFLDIGRGVTNHPYSLYLQILYCFGMMGFAIAIFYIVDNLSLFNSKNKQIGAVITSFIVILIIGLGQCFMDFPRLAGTAITILGMLPILKGEIDVNKV